MTERASIDLTTANLRVDPLRRSRPAAVASFAGAHLPRRRDRGAGWLGAWESPAARPEPIKLGYWWEPAQTHGARGRWRGSHSAGRPEFVPGCGVASQPRVVLEGRWKELAGCPTAGNNPRDAAPRHHEACRVFKAELRNPHPERSRPGTEDPLNSALSLSYAPDGRAATWAPVE
jgi:hypothetical protein